jgi:hypothetical protein
MTLSEDEQTRLDGIEKSLLAEDPGFARSCDPVAAHRWLHRRKRIAAYGFWVGLTVTIVGAAAAQGALSIGTMVSCYGLALLAWSGLTLLRCHRVVPRSNGFGRRPKARRVPW